MKAGTKAGTKDDAIIAERGIVLSRVIEAPRSLVFTAFTETRHLSRFFGPNGFTITTRAFAFREGGEWEFIMHGPDGTDYPNWIRWLEIVPPERMVMLHGTKPGDPDAFHATITLVERGASTEITLRSVFPTRARRDEVVEKFGAIEGGKQHLARLAAYVATLSGEGR